MPFEWTYFGSFQKLCYSRKGQEVRLKSHLITQVDRLGRRSWSRPWLSVLSLILCLGGAHSSPGRNLSRIFTDGQERRVSLYVSVLDQHGKLVSDLTEENFEVFEENKPQKITSLQFEPETPLSLGVLIDISRSMGGERISLALSWLNILAGQLRSPDELFVNAFSNESQEVVDYVSPEDYLEEALDHLGTGGQASMGLAVDLALIKLREARNQKRALLFFSAGRDIAGPATLDHISRFGYPIYAIGIAGAGGSGGTIDKLKNLNVKGSALKVFAGHSGGEAIFVESSSQAETAIERLCLQMKNQYRLEYISTSKQKPGKMLEVELRTKNPNLQVRHLKKYQITSK
jgi:Ca-activated chloride channel homolog